MSNIVKFPNDYVPPEQETLSDLKKSIEKNKEIYINNVVDQHSSNLLANISLSGFNIDKEDFNTVSKLLANNIDETINIQSKNIDNDSNRIMNWITQLD